jgi:hypothetical protein
MRRCVSSHLQGARRYLAITTMSKIAQNYGWSPPWTHLRPLQARFALPTIYNAYFLYTVLDSVFALGMRITTYLLYH